MAYSDSENSARGGEPVELYRFNVGATEWLYTSLDRQYPLAGKTYLPTFIERDNLTVSDEAPREALDVRVARHNPVAAMFNAQAPDGTMYLSIFREHRGINDFIQLGRWRVLAVTWAGAQATLKCQPLFTSLARTILKKRFSITCTHETFDSGCTLAKSAWVVNGTVTLHEGVAMTSAAFAAHPDGYFKGGELDAGSGRKRRILSHVGNAITLTSGIPGVGPGSVIAAYPGDDKRIDGDCLNRFANTINHGGYPYIPDDNPFETGLT